MRIERIQDKHIWESFLKKQSFTLFVQSWQFGECYRLLGEDFWVYGIYEGDELIGGSLIVSTHAKRGKFLYLPYGPVLSYHRPEVFRQFIAHIRSFAKEKGFDFIRVSPFIDETIEHGSLFSDQGFRAAPMHILAETTWLLRIESDAELLLKAMNKNHRNLIHRCERLGVKVEMRTDMEALELFNSLLDVTAKRHGFFRFPRSYVAAEFKAFFANNQAAIFLAYLPDGRLDAGAIVFYYGSMAAYHHGASLNLDKKLPSSYLVQWRAVEEAKKRGMVWYNFWGIAPDTAPESHPFKGITHFKKGFGGYQKDLLHCHDLPLTPWYWVNWAIESFRRYKRGF